MKDKIVQNTASALVLYITTIISGFVLPRCILLRYGSDVNGLVNSIAQFLQVIMLLEFGVGTVTQTALYKPLADGDNNSISKIVASANRYYRKVALVLVGYIAVLCIVFPKTIGKTYGTLYIDTLIIAMSISLFTQYVSGVVDGVLLKADQKGYVVYYTQTITLILNTVTCVVMIYFGMSIQVVKIVTAAFFLLRPVILRLKVMSLYDVKRDIEYDDEPIRQKWNGIAQHIAAFVMDGTDIIVLTVFSSLSDISVYSIYNMIVYGVKQLIITMTAGLQSAMGELWAKGDIENLEKLFNRVEWLIHTITAFVFGWISIIIVAFVSLYTKGIRDTNYIHYYFAFLITLANALHCIRLPYNLLILSAGHYKQTQYCYIIAAIANVVISVLLVNKYGLVGVTVGTLVALIYQLVWMVLYDSKNIVNCSIKTFFKYFCTDIIIITISFYISFQIGMMPDNFVNFIFLAIKAAVVMFFSTAFVNLLFYRKMILVLFSGL